MITAPATLQPANDTAEKVEKVDLEADLTQTQFAAEEPLFEQSELPTKVGAVPAAKKQTLLWLGLAGFGLFCLILAAILALSQQQPEPATTLTPSPSPTIVSPQLQTRLDRLKAELEAADPVKPAIVYPQVETEIRLDEATRNR